MHATRRETELAPNRRRCGEHVSNHTGEVGGICPTQRRLEAADPLVVFQGFSNEDASLESLDLLGGESDATRGEQLPCVRFSETGSQPRHSVVSGHHAAILMRRDTFIKSLQMTERCMRGADQQPARRP